MNAYIIENKNKIEPFNECARNCLIGNKSLATVQKELLSTFGLKSVLTSNPGKINDPDEYIVFDGSIYFSLELLKEFITRSQKKRVHTVCALKSGITTTRTVTVIQDVKTAEDHVEYDLQYFPKEKLRGKCEPLIIDPDKIKLGISMPKHMCDNEKYLIPITDKFIIQINHWVNLWAANIVTILSNIARLQNKSKMKLAILVIKSRSFNPWKILHRLNKIGKNCDIHPTAYIEGSTIGDNVTVGAGAIIRVSAIGNNAWIGSGVVIEESVIGEKNTILHGHILYSVLFPETFSVAQMISTSLIGNESFLGSGVTLTDFRLDGKNVLIIKDGLKIDTKNTFVGSCLGHNVYLGSGCIVAPGRIIPEKTHILPEKKRIIHKPPEDFIGFRTIET